MRSYHIDPMTPDDLDEVLFIERASFQTPWSRGAFLYELRDNQVASCWVARGNDEVRPLVLGYLCAWEIKPELHVTNLAVHPVYLRQGIGRNLLATVLERVRASGFDRALLEVRPSNVEARQLYSAFGFSEIGRRKGYYVDNGEDALVMTADLLNWSTGNQEEQLRVSSS